MEWFRNLFKSNAQKRFEARHREEEAWRASHRWAGPPPQRDLGQLASVNPPNESRAA